MHFLRTHELRMMDSYDPREAGKHLAQFLANTKVTAVNRWSHPAHVGGMRIGAFSFALIDFGMPMSMQAAVRGHHFLMLSCLQGSARMTVDGRTIVVNAGEGFLARPCQYLTGHFSSDCVRLIVRIDSSLLGAHNYPEYESFNVSSPAMQPWFEQVQLLLSSRSLMQAVATDPLILGQMESLLSALLRNAAVNFLIGSKSTTTASRDVRRAEIFMQAHASRTISLKDIAEAAGASARTLQSNFKRYRCTTPMQYLRDVRLDRARDRLLSGQAHVADVAFESGFTHHGRFATYYRGRFGEAPSQTQRRAGKRIRSFN